jgi:dihydroorotase
LYDMLIKGGTVVDPSQGIHAVQDVAIADGKIAAIEGSVDVGTSRETIDARGQIVTPGLIDMHVHAYPGVCCYGLEPDVTNIARGVTTAMDCGSAGARTFSAFRQYFIDRVETRLYALLNISTMGIISSKVGELDDMRWADVEETAATGLANRDVVLGVKVRLSDDVVSVDNKLDALKRGVEAAESFGGIVMIHVGDRETTLETLTAILRPGDIVTHAFRQWGGVASLDREVVPELREARDRGIVFDVGHGAGSCSFDTIALALASGFPPDTISSDVSTISVEGPVFDLVTTMSKFLHFGMSLYDIVRCTTQAPAQVMGLGESLGTLRPGAIGDVTVLSLDQGDFTFNDAEGNTTQARRNLNPVRTIKGGRVYRPWLR